MTYFFFQIFETDPEYEDKTKDRKVKGEFAGPHIRSNCEMCNLLGVHCFQRERSARFRQANEASAAYQNQPDLV